MRKPMTSTRKYDPQLLSLFESLLSRSNSATATLEKWPLTKSDLRNPVTARMLSIPFNAASADQMRRLGISDASELRYRQVWLIQHNRIMSIAENWYVPALLPAKMRDALDQTDTPFGKIIEPLKAHGVTFMSIGLMLDPDKAVVWRGPMLMGALQQMLSQVNWGELDVLIVDLPPGLAGIPASLLGLAQSLTGGLYVNNTLTADQIAQLGVDNVVAEDAKGLRDLGIEPLAMEAVLESYLYAYRPQGQYSRLTESAKNMRGA